MWEFTWSFDMPPPTTQHLALTPVWHSILSTLSGKTRAGDRALKEPRTKRCIVWKPIRHTTVTLGPIHGFSNETLFIVCSCIYFFINSCPSARVCRSLWSLRIFTNSHGVCASNTLMLLLLIIERSFCFVAMKSGAVLQLALRRAEQAFLRIKSLVVFLSLKKPKRYTGT